MADDDTSETSRVDHGSSIEPWPEFYGWEGVTTVHLKAGCEMTKVVGANGA